MKKLSIFVLAFFLVGLVVHANPLAFLFPVSTSTATSNQSYMTAGTATTTLCFDSYSATGVCTSGSTGRQLLTDRATLALQFTGSSTASSLRINIQYSPDNQDWYQDGGVMSDIYATSTKTADLATVSQYTYDFASTTQNLGVVNTATGATSTRALSLRTPMRYMRAIITVPAGSTPGGVWAQMIPVRQQSQ